MKTTTTTKYLLNAAMVMLVAFSFAAQRAARRAGPTDNPPPESEAKLIETLKTGTTPEKAITCKKLAVWGSKNAVPALAPLLLDKELLSWARIALESIPGPEADAALREAHDKVQGRMRVGIINSIAYRGDAQAVDQLAQDLSSTDEDVVAAAGAGLGKIGGDKAAKALEQALVGSAVAARNAAAEGCVLCAERCMAAGNSEQAVKLYDLVRKAEVPKARVVEATRGAIIARGPAAGLPLLVEQLQSANKSLWNVGLRVARELPGASVQKAIVAELGKAEPERQAQLVYVLMDRAEPESLPVVLQTVKSGQKPVRLASIAAIERLGNATCVSLLLETAGDADADVSGAAKSALARLQGKEVEAELLAQFQKATGKMRQALIELAASRRIEGTFPIIIQCAQDPDPGVRAAAIETIGAMGDDKQVADLVKVATQAKDPQERVNAEKALMTLTGRCGAPCVPHLLPLIKTGDAVLRSIALHALAGCGGAEALAAVKATLDDKDEAVQDEAVRTLSTWPNRWPEDASVTEPLLAIAKSPKKPAHKVLALRGYLQFVQGSKTQNDAQKLTLVKEVLPLLTRPEEKRLAISALGTMGGAGATDLLIGFTTEASVAEEACLAIVNGKFMKNAPKPIKQKALQAVLEKTKVDATRNKAQELLKGNR